MRTELLTEAALPSSANRRRNDGKGGSEEEKERRGKKTKGGRLGLALMRRGQ